MSERTGIRRPGPIAVGVAVVVLATLAFSGTLRSWVGAVAGPVVSLGAIVLAVLWLGGKL